MQTFKIKTYEEHHKDQIIQMILSIQTEEFGLPISIKDQPDLEKIPAFYQKEKGNFWVALDNDQMVGTIALIDIGNDQGALRKMFVAKEYRGKNKGIAKLLLSKLLEWSNEKKVNEVYLGTIEIFLAAQRFYEKSGFFEIQKNMLPLNFPVMALDSRFYVYKFT